MSINIEKQIALREKMKEMGIKDEDLLEKFIIGSGRGGQKLQKTSSCVYLKHLPTGIEVKCQRDRSREANRFFARRELCEKIEQLQHPGTSKKDLEIAKLRKQKKRRQRRTEEKIEETDE